MIVNILPSRSRYTAPETKAAIYVRCSTAGIKKHGSDPVPLLNPNVQLAPLKVLVRQRGWEIYRVYSGRMSGAKQARPGLQALMDDPRRGKFQVVLVWRFDRFARNVKQLVLALEEFRSLDIDFVSYQEALDTGTPMGKAVFTIIAAMAELERSIMQERVMAGLEHARRHGTKSGRPIGRPRRIFDRRRVFQLRQGGRSLRQIADELGIGLGTVTRTLKKTAMSVRLTLASMTFEGAASDADVVLAISSQFFSCSTGNFQMPWGEASLLASVPIALLFAAMCDHFRVTPTVRFSPEVVGPSVPVDSEI